jgi:hypothetical protein
MQQLFACLKKWDYDDLHCDSFTEAYNRCVTENLDHINKQKKAIKSKEDYKFHIQSVQKETQKISITSTDADRLFKKYPQPDLGTPPYNVAKRLPHQPYGEDIFGKKKHPGWKG